MIKINDEINNYKRDTDLTLSLYIEACIYYAVTK